MLREGDDFTLEARLTPRQHRLQILQIFRPETGSILQWLRAMVVPFDCNRSISFSARSCVYGCNSGSIFCSSDHVLDSGACRTIERAPRPAVEGFVEMNMHVASGG